MCLFAMNSILSICDFTEEPEDLEEKVVEGVADDQDFVSIKEERTYTVDTILCCYI